jgi:hypothetical protein
MLWPGNEDVIYWFGRRRITKYPSPNGKTYNGI